MRQTHGYRIRSAETWARARADYVSGFTAGEVCERHGLGLSAVRARIRREGWTPQHDPEPDADDGPDLSTAELAAFVWRRMARAMRLGSSVNALRWMRLYEHLTRMGDEEPAADPEIRASPETDAARAHADRRAQRPHKVHDVREFFHDAAHVPFGAEPRPYPFETHAQGP